MDRKKRAIIFIVWGQKYINDVLSCVENSAIQDYDKFLITDECESVAFDGLTVIKVRFQLDGLVRKSEILKFLPEGYNSYLFLDSDTRVIGDIEFGFEKAEMHGMAISPAPHYSLDWFWGFKQIMENEGLELNGQLQYNTGVIFFALTKETRMVFSKWFSLCEQYNSIFNNDQPYLTLAMEVFGFNPYTLSIGYNYRAFGDAISGIVRVWHSYSEMPDDINVFNTVWPPRRVIDGKVYRMRDEDGKWFLDAPAWLK